MRVRAFPVVDWESEFEPAVVPTPANRGHDYDKAQVISGVAYNAQGLPVMANPPTFVKATAHRDRIVIDGVDVTYFRNRATPSPAFGLIQPFAYGSATIEFPQISAVLESNKLGADDLAWVKIGANVRIDRVNPGTDTKVATDYRGVVIAINVEGPTLVLEVGGALAGRAFLRDRQPPLFRKVKDIGRFAFDQVRDLGLPFEPRLGPTVGIELTDSGGNGELDALSRLCAMAVTKAGEQYTLMPKPAKPNTWEFRKKDTTTRDFTLYFDDARIVPSLKRDVSEEPNTYFGYGFTKDGWKLRGDVYPGIEQGDPPAYPFTDGRTFGPGTLDSSADVPGSIDAMIWRLIGVAGLKREDTGDGYDTDVADAIETVQDNAGLPTTGSMTPATWDALYDLNVTGFSILQARIDPLVQRSQVREWNHTPTGVRTSRNLEFDRSRLRVDRTLQMGAVESEQQMRQWCRRDMNRHSGNNWVGTAKVNIAVIRGEHNPGDGPPIEANVMPFRAIRPGMNAWAPRFDGGTLFHVVAVDVDPGGKTGTLTLDTQYRDMLTVTEVIARNRDSRADPARAFMNQHNRKSTASQGSIGTSSRAFGKLTGKVTLTGGTWNVFGVPAGQEGEIRKLRLKTTDTASEFVCAVFGRKISTGRLLNVVGDPFAVNEDGEGPWTDPAVLDELDDNLLLYAAGDAEQPCGYAPRRHTNNMGEVTAHPITGLWVDDANFHFHTYAEPVLYVAVYPKSTCTIERGRIMWVQLEEGS